MRLVVFAYHSVGVQCLNALHKLGADIALVVTHKDDAHEEIWFPSVQKWCAQKKLSVVTPEDPNDAAFVRRLRDICPEAIFSFYYRKILSQDILDCAPKGAFNLHGSLLPKYRGRCPVNWALIHGEKVTGVTLHVMVPKPDAGDIVMQKKVPITQKDTAHSLFGKIAGAAARAVKDFYPLLERGLFKRIAQDSSKATVFGGRKPEDGLFSWDQEAGSIYNMVRALTHPYPGAFTKFAGKDLWVWKARSSNGIKKFQVPGTILSVNKGTGITVAACKGAVLLQKIQWAGEKEKRADVFANEKNIKAGMKLV